MSTTRGQHGTRGMYVMGCRCELCKSAIADDQWARERLKEWTDALVWRDVKVRGICLFESWIDISERIIRAAVEKYA